MTRTLFSKVENHKFIFVAFFIGCALLLGGRYYVTDSLVGGDAIEYYMSLRSAVFDQDVDVINEHEYFMQQVSSFTGFPKQGERTLNAETGKIAPRYTVGNVILLAPFFALGHIVAVAARAIGLPILADGYGLIYEMSAGLGSLIYGFLGVILIYQLGKKMFNAEIAAIGSLAIWLATPLVYYMTMEPLMSHSLSMFCITALIYLWYVTRQERNIYHWAGLGIIGGLGMLVRPQDGLFLLIPIFDQLISSWSKSRSIRSSIPGLVGMGTLAGFATAIFSSQLYINHLYRGSFMNMGYSTAFPFLAAPRLLHTLFSVKTGLVLMSPIMLLALIGLAMFTRDNLRVGILLVVAFLAQWYLVSSWSAPSQGHSFGNRILLNSTVIFAIGFMHLLSSFRKRELFPMYAVGLSGGFVVLNGVLVVLYVFRIIGPAYGT